MNQNFKQVSFNDLLNRSKRCFDGSVIIGYDIDWASDFILEDALKLAESVGIKPTLFLTHKSQLMLQLFNNRKYEFGLHPNFDYLLNGYACNGCNAEQVLKNLSKVFPNVKLIRSHSLTTGSRLKNIFTKYGFVIESREFCIIRRCPILQTACLFF